MNLQSQFQQRSDVFFLELVLVRRLDEVFAECRSPLALLKWLILNSLPSNFMRKCVELSFCFCVETVDVVDQDSCHALRVIDLCGCVAVSEIVDVD